MKFAVIVVFVASLCGCEIVGLDGGTEYDLYVASVTSNCMTWVEWRCLLVKRSPTAEWEFHYGVEGFAHESGYEYRIRVRETTVKDPPQDGSSVRFELVDVLTTTPRVAPERDFSWGQTDSSTYTLIHSSGSYRAPVRLTYTNKSSGTLYYKRCMRSDTTPMFYVQREPPDITRNEFLNVWACVGGVPTGSIAPGASIQMNVDLWSSESPNANPPITMAMRTGIFRIYVQVCKQPEADSDNCKPEVKMLQQSNAFRILPPAS